jgi:hypothetical protein
MWVLNMVSLYEKENFRVYEILILKRAFGPKREELTGG